MAHELLRHVIANRLDDMEVAGIAPSHPDRALLTECLGVLGGRNWDRPLQRATPSLQASLRAVSHGYIIDRDLGDESPHA